MFQRTVNNQPAPGEAGDFYGANPRAVVLAGPEQFVSPEEGLFVGQFAWADTDTGAVSQTYQPGYQIGFLHRENNAIIVEFLGEATMKVLKGLPITLFSQGDFWAKFAGGATPGETVYADPSTGAALAGPASGLNSAVVTASAGFTGTAAMGSGFTIAITANVATITLIGAGQYLSAGDIVTSANIAGLAIGAQLTGTPGGNGTYTFVHADVAAEAATATSNVLNVSAVVRGALQVGSVVTGGTMAANSTVTAFIAGTGGVGQYTISGAAQTVASGTKNANTDVLDVTAVTSGVLGVGSSLSGAATAGTVIVEQLTGAPGGIGTYRISPAQNFASGTVNEGAIKTPWKVNSQAAAGEVAKISTWG